MDDSIARQELTDLIHTYCRAVDRMDQKLLESLYHPDACDDHGHYGSGPARNFLGFTAKQDYRKPSGIVKHHVTNIILKIESSYAEGESSVLGFHVIQAENKTFDFIFLGRYLDKFERRDGQWRFLHRRSVVDLSYELPDSRMRLDTPITEGFHRGTNGPDDPSYAFFRLIRRGER